MYGSAWMPWVVRSVEAVEQAEEVWISGGLRHLMDSVQVLGGGISREAVYVYQLGEVIPNQAENQIMIPDTI